MNKSQKIIIALGVIIGAIRPFMPQRHGFSVEGTYEAVSHIIVGMLFAGWILSENKKPFWITLAIITFLIEFPCALRH
jgi:cation transport ATPase